MNVLIFAPFAVTDYHFATDLEIAQRHLDDGDHVTIAVCNAALLTCEANSEHDLGRCVRCVGDRIEGVSRLSPRPDVISFLRLTAADRREIRNIDADRMTLEDLKSLHFDNFDAGWSVRSSLITALGTSEFDFDSQRVRIRTALRSALAVYRSIQSLVRDLKIDRVYAYNGRFATMRAVLRAAQSAGVDCYIHERGSSFEKYALFKNHLPHEIDFYQDLIRQAWDMADPTLRDHVGASFFADRITGSASGWISYSINQHSGLLPNDWQDERNNVAVFMSSGDEISAVDDPTLRGHYRDQYDAMERIISDTPPTGNIHYYLRMHPRAHDLPEPQAERLTNRQWPHVTVVPSDSPISTYTLMRRASRVLSFGSTTGIEAAYWGKVSISGKRAYYDTLGSTYTPNSHDEMMKMLSSALAPPDRTGALMYGYYQKTNGIPYRFFRPLGLFGGSFKGTPIKPHVAIRTAGWILDHASGRNARSRLHLKVAESRLTTD